jgi:hypothetical protein
MHARAAAGGAGELPGKPWAGRQCERRKTISVRGIMDQQLLRFARNNKEQA